MSACTEQFQQLVHTQEVILNEDLAALRKLSINSRVDRYEQLRADEEEFVWEFSKEHPDFLTSSEQDQVRSKFRLARLLLAASLYQEDAMPESIEDDFIEPELQAVVDFDRYKQFDALSEEQIAQRIRRMEGEVYELVSDYTATQVANVDELVENPEVQQDLIERLLDRYETRRKKIRHGFFIYVETHGLEHMVETIEAAVTAVSEASDQREHIDREIESQLAALSGPSPEQLTEHQQSVESKLWSIERSLSGDSVDSRQLEAAVDSIRDKEGSLSAARKQVSTELSERIERFEELEAMIDDRIEDLETTHEEVRSADDETAAEAASLVADELEHLREQKERLQAEKQRLETERDRIDAAHERLSSHREDLDARLAGSGSGTAQSQVESEDVVTARMARLYEMDYLGRFDISVQEASSIHMPDGSFDVPNGYWSDRNEYRSDRAKLVDALDEGEDPETYPRNQASRYTITTSNYLGLSSRTEMAIEAAVVSHLEAYTSNGFDARPAGLDDLLSVVNEVVTEAQQGEYPVLLGLASPTGWTDRVESNLQDGDLARTRYSQYVSLCLVDLRDGTVLYDSSDELVRHNAELFEMPVDAERVEDCMRTIHSEYVANGTSGSILLSEFVDTHEYDTHVVSEAFDRLEAKGVGEQLYLEDLGVCLDIA